MRDDLRAVFDVLGHLLTLGCSSFEILAALYIVLGWCSAILASLRSVRCRLSEMPSCSVVVLTDRSVLQCALRDVPGRFREALDPIGVGP